MTLAVAALAALAGAGEPPGAPPEPKPPAAARRPAKSVVHGEARIDDYAWLQKRDAPEVRAHLEAENAYAAAVLAPAKPLHEKLFAEMKRAREAGIDGRPDAAKGPRYETSKLTARARDGTAIPLTLTFRAGLKPDGTAPLVIYGFGAYGSPLPTEFAPAYAPERVPLLDRGVVFAFAHVRGGGEGGEAWHAAGRVATKMTSFTDFVDATEHLIRERWAARDRVVAMGESAGGLLVTAAMNLRPELFRCVLALFPFVDCLGTMLDPTLPGTRDEYDEWGDPRDPAQYKAMRAWSPIDNLAPVAYPALYARTALDDDEVMYWEPAKYVARLRAVGKGKRPAVLRTALGPCGHIGPEDPVEALRERAWDFAFALREVGF